MRWPPGSHEWTNPPSAIPGTLTFSSVALICPRPAARSKRWDLFIVEQPASASRVASIFFLDGSAASARDAVRVVFASEKVRPDSPVPAPDVTEAELADQFRLITLEGLVRMKLAAFRDKDRTHVRDLIEVGLVDASWIESLEPELRRRLQIILDTPEG